MVSENPSLYEQLKAFDKSESQRRFIEAMDAATGVQITSEDILTAARFERDELFIIALLTIARQRIARSGTNEETQ